MIDVVTAIHKKDQEVCELCIDSVKKYCKNIGKIYAVSEIDFTRKAIHIPEKSFPFTMQDIKDRIEKKGQTGWYWQQIMQFYLWDIIPRLSDTILFINSDVILMKPLEMIQDDITYHNYNDANHEPYQIFVDRMIGKNIKDKFGTTHYMVYKKDIINALRKEVEDKYKCCFWEAFCKCIVQEDLNGSSEFELYFTYLLKNYVVMLKKLKYADKGDFWNRKEYKNQGYDYVAFHAYLRGKR